MPLGPKDAWILKPRFLKWALYMNLSNVSLSWRKIHPFGSFFSLSCVVSCTSCLDVSVPNTGTSSRFGPRSPLARRLYGDRREEKKSVRHDKSRCLSFPHTAWAAPGKCNILFLLHILQVELFEGRVEDDVPCQIHADY